MGGKTSRSKDLQDFIAEKFSYFGIINLPSTVGRGRKIDLSKAKVRFSGEGSDLSDSVKSLVSTVEKTAGLPRSQGYLLPRNDMGRKAAFTLAEGATHVAQSAKPRRVAFTLAEVLITLGIIGVVAAIILPMFMENITERRNSERHANIVYKVTQAMEMMKVHGELGRRYDTTEAFVDELQKYLKVSKRCDANHIADCWPTAKVTDGEGNEFEVSKAKTGKNLSLESNTNNVGLILADGASIILNYNPEGGKIDETDPIIAVKKSLPVGGGRSKEFVYTSNVTGSIDFVTDVNGSAAPNAETSNNVYHDIRNLTAARFTKGCAGTELSGIGCVVNVGTSYDPISEEPYTSNNNYWAGAKAKCESMGMTLPDKGTLKNIAAQKASNPNLPQSGYFWSSSESNTYYASGVNFFNGNENNYHKNSPDGVLCVGN